MCPQRDIARESGAALGRTKAIRPESRLDIAESGVSQSHVLALLVQQQNNNCSTSSPLQGPRERRAVVVPMSVVNEQRRNRCP
jgi:hypothetical protein